MENEKSSGSLVDEINSLISGISMEEGGDEVVEPAEGAEGETTTEEEEIEDIAGGVEEEEVEEVKEETEETEVRREGKEEEVTSVIDEPTGEVSETDEVAELKARLERQQKTIDELSGKITKPVEAPVIEPEQSISEFDVSEEEFDELVSDRKKFVEFFRSREKQLMDVVRNSATTNVMKTLPAAVMQQVQYANTLQTAIKNFWGANQDLMPVRKTVGIVANEVYAENPNMTVEQVFSAAGTRVREMLGIKNKIETKTEPKKVVSKKPAFAKQRSGGARGGNQQGTKQSLADAIDSLL